MEQELALAVNRKRQERFFYCAPACAQMILDYHEKDNTPSQDEIWNQTRPFMSDEERWYTDPGAFGRYFKETRLDSYGESSHPDKEAERVVTSVFEMMRRDNSPPAILIHGGRHWVVVSGGMLSAAGQPSGVFVTDPGKGMIETVFYPFSESFFKEYFCPVTVEGKWKGERVFVGKDYSDSQPLQLMYTRSNRAGGLSSEKLLPGDFSDIACLDLLQCGFAKVRNVKAGGAHSPVVVRTRDQDDYMITPVESDGRLFWAAVDINDLATQSVLMSEDFLLPPCEEMIRESLMKKTGSQNVVIDENFWFVPHFDAFSKFDVVKRAKIEDREFLVRSDGTLIDSTDRRGTRRAG